ncbi:gamma-interferon-inducible lysosomal thiol reductase [Hydra vulgaris]|uniref:Gamma-interferon-inducible lysosomal thiol reductase n=1 Tax=Hydra vulgaris TaxID=6087 RepID=A0ABM4DEE6_HYDVU
MISLLVFCSLVVLNIAFPHENRCDSGEKYWCKSYETALECGVLAFCQNKNPNFRAKKITFSPKGKLENPTEEIVFVENAAPPVKIELYYESLCPGCRAFILSQLFPVFQKLFSTGIIDIGLYPYGNAVESQEGDKWVFQCQHGEAECQNNLIEACVLHMLSHPSQFMPFIYCLEQDPSLSNAMACASKLKIEWASISTCYNGTQGNHLMHELALKTNALNPPHQYVPWIVANGQHTEEIQSSAQSDLLQFVCQTYTGVKPDVCQSTSQKRCYKN